MAGFESYLDAVVADIEASKGDVSVISVHDSIDWENHPLKTHASYPIVMVEAGPVERASDEQIEKIFDLTIMILVSIANAKQKPVDWRDARATAADIEDWLIETILRNVSGYEEPERVLSTPGLVSLSHRKVYGVGIDVTTRTPFIR